MGRILSGWYIVGWCIDDGKMALLRNCGGAFHVVKTKNAERIAKDYSLPQYVMVGDGWVEAT